MLIKSNLITTTIERAARLHSPDQRLIMGVTALATQPFIDLNNKKADEDTRILSTCRTIAKIIAGTISGVVVRSGCIRAIDKLSKEEKVGGKVISQGILCPKRLFRDAVHESGNVYDKKLDSYNKTLGTAAAVGVMIFTNFLWDAPVTKKLTNFFYSKATKKEVK